MNYKYGTFTDDQIVETKKYIRKQIFYFILYVDPVTRHDYSNVDVVQAFENIQMEIAGLNGILNNPPELVRVAAYLYNAEKLYTETNFDEIDFSKSKYRKCILDAGSEIMKIKED